MKKFEKRPRGAAPESTRTGPRARAADERRYSDPYARAERPRPPAGAGFEGGRPAGRPAVITLDPDVARVFKTSDMVNEALRMVMRLARFSGGPRPAFTRDRPPGDRPRSFAGNRGAPRGERQGERRGPPRARTPRFEDEG